QSRVLYYRETDTGLGGSIDLRTHNLEKLASEIRELVAEGRRGAITEWRAADSPTAPIITQTGNAEKGNAK
ncbi:MAG: hypothetical protein B7X02_01865, partial [Rhodospirillales bacterium 12-54-5]